MAEQQQEIRADVSDNLHAQIKRVAKYEERPISYLIRKWVREKIMSYPKDIRGEDAQPD